MTEWQVTYTVDVEADTPEEGAKKVADMLTRNDGAAAKRAVYVLREHKPGSPDGLGLIRHSIDLDRPERGGQNYFGEGDVDEQ